MTEPTDDPAARERADLLQSEARYRHLADAMPQIVWVARAGGQYEYFNRRWYAFTGLSVEESLRLGWPAAAHPDDAAAAAQKWQQAAAAGEPLAVECRLRSAAGEYRWFLVRSESSRGADGRVAYWYGTCTDIDDQKQAQQELLDSQEQFRTLVDSLPQLAWLARPDGHIYWYNKRWYDYTGTTPEQMEGWGWQSVHDPDLLPGVVARFKEAIEAGRRWEDTFPLRRHDGAMRWFLSRAVPLRDRHGRVARWVGTNTDVHDAKQAEESVRQAKAEAEQANQAKSLFLANMSHELRTPLNAILMYSELLEEEAEDAGAEGSLADLRKIQAAGKHLLGLINNILDLSKVEAGKMELSPETFDVAGAAREVAATIEPLAQKNRNRLEVALAADLGSMHADLTKLRQCLFNLLSNACKFTQDGAVTLAAGREPGGEGADALVFRVSDTGIGMTAEQVRNLFQPFSQADASTTRKYGGTGLGLAITRRIAELMGGSVEVASEPGRGTTFTLRLPAEVGAPRRAPARERAEGPGGTAAGTVLVIDDDPAVSDLMVRFLTREGYRAVTAGDGEDGLRLAREVRPDVITLDVMMPRMDGWAVLRALKADADLAHVPVIMMTILDEKNLGYLLGATEYMTKPINRERLGALLRKYRPAPGGVVLLVEDDEGVRRVLRGVLEGQGWSVAEAANGREALGWLDGGGRPGLILLDLVMPEVDGFEVIAGLRRRPELRSIPVVVLTSKELTEEDRRRLNGGVEKVLQKGASTSQEVLEEVRRLLAAHTGASPPGQG